MMMRRSKPVFICLTCFVAAALWLVMALVDSGKPGVTRLDSTSSTSISPKVPGRTFFPDLSKLNTFAAAPLVLTPFVRNQWKNAGTGSRRRPAWTPSSRGRPRCRSTAAARTKLPKVYSRKSERVARAASVAELTYDRRVRARYTDGRITAVQ